ncbi:hypothetical protein, partial [Pseudomonas viridiflava]|uniref:hypothetical protein n=1 Tax=Pseudomonas viridiflava TaxID=33069 RepID=UPI0013DEE07C
NWINDGLIASDGAMTLTLEGAYSGNGRASSLGAFDLQASRMKLAEAASIAGGAQTDIDIDGVLENQGRSTSVADLIVTAGELTNGGTLGSRLKL